MNLEKMYSDPEFEKLSSKIRNKKFNQFKIFEDVFSENSISRILAMFFDTDSNYELGNDFLKNFIQFAHLRNKHDSFNDIDFNENISVTATCEASTYNNRRIDILLEVFSNNEEAEEDDLLFVIGLELKKWAGEQENQLRDYQNFLAKKYKHCPKVMLFLTPKGSSSSTSIYNEDCPCYNISYKSVYKTCMAQYKNIDDRLKIFLERYGEYMASSFTNKELIELDKSIKEFQKRFPEEVKAIVQTGERIKTPRSYFYEYLVREINAYKSIKSAHISWCFRKKSANPVEYNFDVNGLNWKCHEKKLPFSFYYMLHNEAGNPLESNEWALKLMIFCDDRQGRDKADEVQRKYLEENNVSFEKAWGPWLMLERGENLVVNSMSKKESERHAATFVDFVGDTERKLSKLVFDG